MAGGRVGPGVGERGGYQKPKNAKKTIARLLTYLTRSKALLALVFAMVILSAGASVAGTYLLRPLINQIADAVTMGSVSVQGFGTGVLWLALVNVVAAAATYGQSAIMAQLAQKGCNRLRRDLFDKLQTMPLKYFDAHTHGELMSRFTNDTDNVQMAMEQSVISLFSSALTFVGVVVMMVYVSWQLFLISVVILTVTVLVFRYFGGKSRTYFRQQQASLGAVNGNIQEVIEGLKVVKAFTHEEAAQADFDRLNETYRVASSQANFYSTAIMPIAGNIMNISLGVLAGAGGVLALLTGFDIGGLSVYLTYARQVAQPINQVSQQINAILSALAGAERIFEVMDADSEPDEGQVELVPTGTDGHGHAHAWAWRVPRPDGTEQLIPLRGDVRLEHVDFSYVPGKPVLRDVSVYAKPGQKIAFVGSTGAGKTTITNLVNRFYEIDAGSITYDGLNVRDIKKDSLRSSLGAVLQDTHLFTGTVMENIRYGRLNAADEECVAAAKSANAHSFIRRLPNGYQTVVTGDGANLSQGQRQLLAIARAAVADPPVMILDEATSSIDTRTEALIQTGMDALMDGRTVFVIAHRLSTVRNADAIAVIEQGRVVERGDHEKLLKQEGRYYQLYTGQFQLE